MPPVKNFCCSICVQINLVILCALTSKQNSDQSDVNMAAMNRAFVVVNYGMSVNGSLKVLHYVWLVVLHRYLTIVY